MPLSTRPVHWGLPKYLEYNFKKELTSMWSSYFCNGTVRMQSWKLWQTINLLTAINFWWFMVNHKSALSMTLILGLDFPPSSILQSICKHSFSTDSNWWWVQIQFNLFFALTHERVNGVISYSKAYRFILRGICPKPSLKIRTANAIFWIYLGSTA